MVNLIYPFGKEAYVLKKVKITYINKLGGKKHTLYIDNTKKSIVKLKDYIPHDLVFLTFSDIVKFMDSSVYKYPGDDTRHISFTQYCYEDGKDYDADKEYKQLVKSILDKKYDVIGEEYKYFIRPSRWWFKGKAEKLEKFAIITKIPYVHILIEMDISIDHVGNVFDMLSGLDDNHDNLIPELIGEIVKATETLVKDKLFDRSDDAITCCRC